MRLEYKSMKEFAERHTDVKDRMQELSRMSWRELNHVANFEMFSVCFTRARREYLGDLRTLCLGSARIFFE